MRSGDLFKVIRVCESSEFVVNTIRILRYQRRLRVRTRYLWHFNIPRRLHDTSAPLYVLYRLWNARTRL